MFATVLNVPVVNKLDNFYVVFRGLVSILLNFREELYSISPFSKFCLI